MTHRGTTHVRTQPTTNATHAVTAKEGADVTSTMFTGGQPTALCGGLLWSVPEGGNDDTPFIYGVNPVAGGKVELTINLQQFEAASWAGAVAC